MKTPKDIDINMRAKALGLKLLLIALIILAGELKSCSAMEARPSTLGIFNNVRSSFKRASVLKNKKRKNEFAVLHACEPKRRVTNKPVNVVYGRFR